VAADFGSIGEQQKYGKGNNTEISQLWLNKKDGI